jgi:flagellar hook-associated protein 2
MPYESPNIVSIRNRDGSEIPIAIAESSGEQKISISLSDYPNRESLVVRNENTGKALTLSPFSVVNEQASLGYEPVNPASRAADAKLKYEGITITRSTNTIDDVVPDVTINLWAPTERTATITIQPDIEAAKNALITFVGRYNQTMAEINILTQTKPEIIAELEYLTVDEQEAARERLGMFQGDSMLNTAKSSFQGIMASRYASTDDATIMLLAQIGISTKTGASAGYSPASLRGYLEMDEKKLDEVLKTNLNEVKNIFGYDTDSDKIIDSGIAFQLDRRLLAYVQTNGILSTKTSGLDTSIASTEGKIKRLEEQLDNKEQQLRRQYGQMESTLNSLEGQSTTISNFANRGRSNN